MTDQTSSQRRSLAPFVKILGTGPARSRSLTREEAAEAMEIILSGRAEPEAVGGLLMLMRYRGENADEIAGFVDAMRSRMSGWSDVEADLDWPSYAAGRSRGAPWFLLAVKLVAQAGIRVFLHGWNSHQNPIADVRSALEQLQIPVARTPGAAQQALVSHHVAYVPLEDIDAASLGVLRLRDKLGLRSAMNTAVRACDPTGALHSVQAVFHPPYLTLQRDSGAKLGMKALTVIKGGGGEFERHPGKSVRLLRIVSGNSVEEEAPALIDFPKRLSDLPSGTNGLAGFWAGEWSNDEAESAVVGTAALALLTVGRCESLEAAQSMARYLWESRGERDAWSQAALVGSTGIGATDAGAADAGATDLSTDVRLGADT